MLSVLQWILHVSDWHVLLRSYGLFSRANDSDPREHWFSNISIKYRHCHRSSR